MAKTDNLKDFLTDVADAIREKSGESGLINPQDFSARIAAIQTGGGGVVATSPKAVNFRDYDGTILHSYTKEEFLALTSMPELPTREGLICQGWNCSFEDAVAYVTDNGRLDVGATYITDDGKTRLYITIAAEGRMDVPLYFQQTIANGVTIDWGDGSATQTLGGTGSVNTTHTYAEIGEYTISLNPSSGCTLRLGQGSSSYCVMGTAGTNGRVYSNMLQAVEVGKNVTSIDSYTFYYCYSLSSIVIPNGVTSIGNYTFRNCYSLSSIVIPNGVTSIGSYTFDTCNGMAYYDFRQCASIPALGGTSVFNGISSDCKIVVPDSLYDTWIAATNWSAHASKIVKASDFNA